MLICEQQEIKHAHTCFLSLETLCKHQCLKRSQVEETKLPWAEQSSISSQLGCNNSITE